MPSHPAVAISTLRPDRFSIAHGMTPALGREGRARSNQECRRSTNRAGRGRDSECSVRYLSLLECDQPPDASSCCSTPRQMYGGLAPRADREDPTVQFSVGGRLLVSLAPPN